MASEVVKDLLTPVTCTEVRIAWNQKQWKFLCRRNNENCQSFEKNTTNTGLKRLYFFISNALKMIICNTNEVTRCKQRDEDVQIASNHGVVQNNIDQIYVLHIKYVRTAWMKM